MIEFKIDKSPFKFERNYHAKSVSKSFRLPEDVFKELMIYYDGVFGEENNPTKAFNDLAIEKLDNICRERKAYQDLNIMMLIPKTDDLEVLNKNSEIIGFFTVDDVSDLNQDVLIRDESEDTILIRNELGHTTIEQSYNFIKYINPKCFKFDMNDVSSIDDFKIRLNKAYPKIDLSDAYVVQFELNNYFDIFRNGEFQSSILNNTHIGAYTFFDMALKRDGASENRKLYCIIRWKYNSNILNLDFRFMSDSKFMRNFTKDDIVDNKVIDDEITFIFNDGNRKEILIDTKNKLEEYIEEMNEQLKLIEDMIENEYPELSDDD